MTYNCKNEFLLVLTLAAVQFVHMVDFVIMMPLGPRFMSNFNIDPAQFATLVSSYTFSAGVSGLFIGLFADRFDRKNMLIMNILGLFVGNIFCAISKDHSGLMLARVCAGFFAGMINATLQAIITDIVPVERRGKAMSVLMSAFSMASVVGIPLGLMIADAFGWPSAFYFIAIFSILLLIPVLVIIPKMNLHLNQSLNETMIKNYINVGLKGGYSKPFLLAFLVSSSTFLLIPFLAPYAVGNMGISNHQIKYMYFFGGIATVIAARIFGRLTDRFGAVKIYCAIAITAIFPVLLYTNMAKASLAQYILIGTFFMVIVSGRMIPFMTLISSIPKLSQRGSFMGIFNSIRFFASAIAVKLGGGSLLMKQTVAKLKTFGNRAY